MTFVVAEAIQEYVARQDLAPIAEQIAASERRYTAQVLPRRSPASDEARS
jgi:hypothetical protein